MQSWMTAGALSNSPLALHVKKGGLTQQASVSACIREPDAAQTPVAVDSAAEREANKNIRQDDQWPDCWSKDRVQYFTHRIIVETLLAGQYTEFLKILTYIQIKGKIILLKWNGCVEAKPNSEKKCILLKETLTVISLSESHV
ncbi:hypothetical protein AMECASPLE_031497 [Ameca splendens]|uniref:Uncharacterized protein n=1 Tax=Ameca splendens TaxID=208324 RepID=A0ABV0XVB7_9TELE